MRKRSTTRSKRPPVPVPTPKPATRWLLLIHQIPPKPDYLRVKIGRRLQRIGAVAVKNSVYVLPATDEALEAFHCLSAEILEGGGDAVICRAEFLAGVDEDALRAALGAVVPRARR